MERRCVFAYRLRGSRFALTRGTKTGRLGVTHPTAAASSRGMVVGIKAYFDKINSGNTLPGHKLKLVTVDDNLQASKMLELTQKFVDDPSVVGLLGYLNSAGLAELTKQDIPRKDGIALIAPVQGDKHIVSAANVFPLRSGYADEVIMLLKEAKSWGKDSIALVSMNVAFGPSLAKLTAQLSAPQGIAIAAVKIVTN